MELAWGFGRDTRHRPAGAESPGTVPTREWLYYYWKDKHKASTGASTAGRTASYVQQIEYDDCQSGNVWEPGQAAIAAIGQGYVTVTPLQLADAYAALANGGTLYSPRIGEALISPAGKVVQQDQAAGDPAPAGGRAARWPTSGRAGRRA